MKTRFRLIHRGERGRQFYCVDSETGKRWSLKTKDRDAAEQIVLAKNQALRQPALNLQIAKAYLAGTDNGVTTRTWQHAIESLTNTKLGANKERWERVVKDAALMPLLPLVIIETKGGALVDERGNVVGVVSAKLNASAALALSGTLPENVNYAVKSSYLLSFLESVPDVANKLKEASTKEKKFEDVVKEAEQAAVLVLVY